jgi:hypothetical protein
MQCAAGMCDSYARAESSKSNHSRAMNPKKLTTVMAATSAARKLEYVTDDMPSRE